MSRLRCSVLRRIFVLALLALLPTGCAIMPVPTRSAHVGGSDALGSCADFFADLDQRAAYAQVFDSGAFRVEGYPYLRINRFLASFRKEVGDQAAFTAWVDQMQALDQDARRYEIANLPQATGSIPGSANDTDGLYAKVASCGNLLKAADFKDSQPQEALRERATAPDEYMALPRVLGFYPLISLFVSHGVSNWHAEARKTFSTEPPVGWQTSRYVPEKSNELPAARAILAQAQRDALGIPDYAPHARQALFRIYAPVWEVRAKAEFDRIGTPAWTSKDELNIDTRQPRTYTLLSFTRFGKEILTQLNYIIWFPSRPRENALDIYGGCWTG